jgi:hypothetical protein
LERNVVVVSLVGCLLFGCGSDGSTASSRNAQCTANAQVPCMCLNGARGIAVCDAEGVISTCGGCPSGAAAGTPGVAGASTLGTPTLSAGVGAAVSGAAGIAAAAGTGATTARAGASGVAAAGMGGVLMGAAGAAGIAVSAAGVGAAGVAPAANGCAAGEMCKPSPLGGIKFCTADPSAALPPSCPMAGPACGTNGKGLCIDAASVGFAGMVFCIYTSC